MRTLGMAVLVAMVLLTANRGLGGERLPNVSQLPVGFRYCPAPGADNSDFNNSYYAIDARTGQMSRYVDGQPHQDLEPVDTEEKVLFVAPPVNVENRYVPFPGGQAQQAPPEFANSMHGDNPEWQRQQAYHQQPMQPQQQPYYNQPPQQQYPQREYAHRPEQPRDNRQANNRQPWWRRVLR